MQISISSASLTMYVYLSVYYNLFSQEYIKPELLRFPLTNTSLGSSFGAIDLLYHKD